MKRLALLLVSAIVTAPPAMAQDTECYIPPDSLTSVLRDIIPYPVIEMAMTKSTDFKNMWFVTAVIGSDPAIFITNWPAHGYGVIYSVNDYALRLTGMGDVHKTDMQISQSTDGYWRSQRCAHNWAAKH